MKKIPKRQQESHKKSIHCPVYNNSDVGLVIVGRLEAETEGHQLSTGFKGFILRKTLRAKLQLQSGVAPGDGRAAQPPLGDVSQHDEQHLRGAAEGHDEGRLRRKVCLQSPERQLHDRESQQAVLDAHLDADRLPLWR